LYKIKKTMKVRWSTHSELGGVTSILLVLPVRSGNDAHLVRCNDTSITFIDGSDSVVPLQLSGWLAD